MRKRYQELNKHLGEHLPTSVQCSSPCSYPASSVFTGHYGEMLSCNRALGYKHQSVPQSDRDVNHVTCTNGEFSVFHYNGKCCRSYLRITAKPPSCLHFLREPLKHFPIPVYFHCLTNGKWRKCGLWESSTALCPYGQPPSLKKGEVAKGWVLWISVCISLPKTQLSDQQILQGDGHFRVLISTERVKCVKNKVCGNKGLSSLFFLHFQILGTRAIKSSYFKWLMWWIMPSLPKRNMNYSLFTRRGSQTFSSEWHLYMNSKKLFPEPV